MRIKYFNSEGKEYTTYTNAKDVTAAQLAAEWGAAEGTYEEVPDDYLPEDYSPFDEQHQKKINEAQEFLLGIAEEYNG